jgi:hypothetical protein
MIDKNKLNSAISTLREYCDEFSDCSRCLFYSGDKTSTSYEGRYAVRCNYCRIGTDLTKNEQNAIELWNHRTEVSE